MNVPPLLPSFMQLLFKFHLLQIHFVRVDLELLGDLHHLVLLLFPLPQDLQPVASIAKELVTHPHQVSLSVRKLCVTDHRSVL